MENEILEKLTALYGESDDFRLRKLHGGSVVVVSLDTISKETKIAENVLKPLLCANIAAPQDVEYALATASVKSCVVFDDAVGKFFGGYALIFFGQSCYAVDVREEFGRSVAEPPTSLVLHGPREGFVEDVKANLTLLRKRLKTPSLRTACVTVGKYTSTTVCVCYLKDVAAQNVVDEVLQCVSSIVIDGVADSSYIAAYLDKQRTKLFHRVGMTEKPDVATAKLLEGRVVVLVDGSPMALTLPYLFIEDLQGPADYYEGGAVTGFGRSLRLVSVLTSVLLPALFVCLQKFNYQIIPLKFLITVMNATDAIPFPPLAEMVLVIVVFDVLREANLRMPTAVGMSLSLVGAIVLGDAAVSAGLVGAPAVMIGALSGIGLYAMPDNTLVLSILRLAFTVVGGIAGLFGVLLMTIALLAYMVGLQEYTAPFLAPYAPTVSSDKQDAVWQRSVTDFFRRPESFDVQNKVRRGK